jgi:hypothetical protein
MATNNNVEVTGWVGWIYFAGFMMLMMGFFQAVLGLTALLNDQFYVALHGKLLLFDFTTWGWIHLVLGIVVLLAGMSLFTGSMWARVVGVLIATFSILVNFTFLSVYPLWSIVVMIVDVLIIYALTVHGGELRVDR